ncbi:unnamed protein product [Prorocentrum cordatum]|uniref:Uncharacterized protein n=1 Tax=Prorocentrum cordatum TaxID=2364126 RepID=A0ABN9TS69_9DINO|nr:unnamed protein product [Polarella glacialis]
MRQDHRQRQREERHRPISALLPPLRTNPETLEDLRSLVLLSPRPSLRAARRTSSSRPPDPSRLRTLWRATPMAGAAVRPHPRGQVLPRPPPASPAPARSACAPATTAALTTSDAGGDGDVEGEGEEEEDDDDEADDDDEGDATTTTTTTAATTTREADGDDDGGGGDGNSGDGGGGDDGRRHAEAP